MDKLNINKNLLPMKAHYFLFNAGTAPVVPFMPTFARQLGFSTVVVGTIYTILPVVGMLAKPSFGALADRFQRKKLLFLLFLILTAVSFFAIKFIPPIPQESRLDLHCNNGVTELRYCPTNDTNLQDCIVDQMQNDRPNEALNCKLSCDTKPWMWDTICNYWNVPEFCKKNRNSSQLEFTSVINITEILLANKCVYFRIHQGDFADGTSSKLYCPHAYNDTEHYFSTGCNVECDNSIVTDTITQSKIADNDVTGLYQFWLLFFFLVFSWIGMAVVVSVGDAICFEMLNDKPFLYGNQRLWGAVGWGIFSLISGLLVDEFSQGESKKDYSIVFYMMLGLIALDMIVSSKLKHVQTKLSTNIIKDVGTIFTSFRIIIFFLWCIGVGLCTALIWNFLFWHLEDLASLQEGCDHQTWIKTLEGLAMGIQCFGGELPFFFLSGWILKKIGHIHAMSLVLLGFGIRFLLYSVLTNPWWVLPIELLNGVTFGIFYATMASYASIVAPPGTEATLQGLVGAVFEGIGVSLGSLMGGIAFSQIGGSATFRWFGIGALTLFCIHVAIQAIYDRIAGSFDLTSQYRTPSDAMHMLDDDEQGNSNT